MEHETELYVVGRNACNNLGMNEKLNGATSKLVKSDGCFSKMNIKEMVCGNDVTIAVDSNGKLVSTGYKAFGQLSIDNVFG